MFIDEEYVEENFDNLKEMIENGTFKKDKCNNFIIDHDLSYEFSGEEIYEMQCMFMDMVKEYFSENHPKQYAIWRDWCVHIATVEIYRDIMWNNKNVREEYIKLKESIDII